MYYKNLNVIHEPSKKLLTMKCVKCSFNTEYLTSLITIWNLKGIVDFSYRALLSIFYEQKWKIFGNILLHAPNMEKEWQFYQILWCRANKYGWSLPGLGSIAASFSRWGWSWVSLTGSPDRWRQMVSSWMLEANDAGVWSWGTQEMKIIRIA